MVVRGADLAAYPQAHRLAPARIVAEGEHAQLEALPGRGPREAGRKGWGRLDPGRVIAVGPRTDRLLVPRDGPGGLPAAGGEHQIQRPPASERDERDRPPGAR